jgi:hypothetical protein
MQLAMQAVAAPLPKPDFGARNDWRRSHAFKTAKRDLLPSEAHFLAKPEWSPFETDGTTLKTDMKDLVKKLKDERGDRMKLWPFETGWKPLTAAELDGVEVVAAEIYPSLLKIKAGEGEIKDQAQVRLLCEHFCALDEKGQLAAAFGPKSDDPRREAVEGEEGWILGV